MKDFMRFVLRFVAPYKWYVVVSVIFNLLATFFTVFSFAFIMPILKLLFNLDNTQYVLMDFSQGSTSDVLVNNFYYYTSRMIAEYGPGYTLGMLCVMLVAMTFVKVAVTFASDWWITPVRNGVERDMREMIYNKVLSLPIGFFTNERKGDIMARCTGDIIELQVSVMASIQSLLRHPIMILGCLAMMLYLSWQLTVFVFILIPVVGGVIGLVGKRLKRESLESQNMSGAILSNIEETIGGLRIIKAFNAESQMESRFDRMCNAFYRINNALCRRLAAAHPVSEFIGTAAVALLLWVGGTMILTGISQIDASMFIYYMVMFYSIINPAKELSKTGYTVQKGMGAMTRVEKLLDAENPIADPANPKQLKPDMRHCGIRFCNVSFTYDGEREVLQDINLDIKAGETVAIVGQSGSGKSTMADLIPRFWDVSKGSVEIEGIDVRDLRVHDLRNLMGNVNQEAILFNDTIYNNIAFGKPGATREEVERAAHIANAHEFIMETENGYDTMIGDRGCRLSGGQRQRISIARAVLKNPAVLILDEATSALDTESERLVQDALDRLMRDRTTVVIAHRLSTIVNADKICVLNQGRIAEVGTHDELLAQQGIYKHLVDMQQV